MLSTSFTELTPAEQLAIKKEKCKRSLFYFVQQFWATIVHAEPIWNWHMPYLCHELEQIYHQVAANRPKKHDLLVNISPGTSKTSLASIFFPTWCWLNSPWMRFIAASYSGPLSLEISDKSRDILKSEKFRKWFPEIRIRSTKDAKGDYQIEYWVPEKARYVLGGSRLATSVGGTVTGFHGDILLVDDPLDPNRAASTTEINAANYWFDQTLPTRKTDKAVTPTILIMQRLAPKDPSGHLLSKKKLKIKHICLPGDGRKYAKQIKPKHLRKFYKDGLFDVNRLTWGMLDELEVNLGAYGYAGQIGQTPAPLTGAMFDVKQFVTISEIPHINPKNIEWVRYWDKAGTPGAGAYTVGVKMGKVKKINGKPHYIIADVKRGQWASGLREEKIRQTAEEDGPDVRIYIEQEPGSGGKESAENTIDNLDGFAVYADRPTGNKVIRADPYSVQVNRGNVSILDAGWTGEFKEEHRFFPNSTYKDQVDSAAGAYNKLTRVKRAGTWGKRRKRIKRR